MLREARLGTGVSQTELGQRLAMSQLLISRGGVGEKSVIGALAKPFRYFDLGNIIPFVSF